MDLFSCLVDYLVKAQPSRNHIFDELFLIEHCDSPNTVESLAALPAILAYILNERQPPVDDHKDDRWLDAFLEARDMSYEVGNH